jgi:hypothetical protein
VVVLLWERVGVRAGVCGRSEGVAVRFSLKEEGMGGSTFLFLLSTRKISRSYEGTSFFKPAPIADGGAQ